jgi:hypothetical protein
LVADVAQGVGALIVAKPFPKLPKHPERICWGCDKYCSVDDLGCGNGSDRTQHPMELLGEDWYLHGDWGREFDDAPAEKYGGNACGGS